MNSDAFVIRAITAFLVPVALSAISYFLISVLARFHSSTARMIYFRRLFLMFFAVVIWWIFYPILTASVFIGNWADPHNAERYASWMAKRLGTTYGVHAIWAWVIIALVDRPKLPPKNALQPAAGGAPVRDSPLSRGVSCHGGIQSFNQFPRK
jgi:hypothetical protein